MDGMLRLAALAAAGASMLAVAASAGGATSPGLIVFQATPAPGQQAQLFSIQPSGAGLKQLTKGTYPALDPAFSPAGLRIAFARFGVGIFVMKRNGTGLHRLTKNPRDAYPTWSPNGKTIAFVRPVGQKWRLYVMPSTGGKARQLKQTPPAGRPTWTKAGILVPTGGDLVAVDAEKGRVQKYYGANIDAIWGLNSVALSPAVSMLTYIGARASDPGDMECGEGACQRFGLFLENLKTKGKKPHLIAKDAGPAAFSPDGRRIAFATNGAIVLRSVTGDTTTTISTGDVVPTTGSPLAWR
jgi:hypothetical protein